MIGVKKNIIAVSMGPVDVVMFNPVIMRKAKPYETEFFWLYCRNNPA